MPHREALKAGDTIFISNDEYTIKSLLSRGGTSLIYEAFRPYCDNNLLTDLEHINVKKVIIKELAPFDIPFRRGQSGMDFFKSDINELENIFTSEIQNLSKIQSQNKRINCIPDMDAFGKYCGTMYIAMSHIKGDILSNYIRENKLNSEVICNMFRHMLKIIKELHNMDEVYLHLDLKPSNFIVGGLGTIYLFDFGSSLITEDCFVKNYTENYSAPEVIFNQVSKICKASDMYSLGVILYEMITKRIPSFEELLMAKGKYYNIEGEALDFNPLLGKLLEQNVDKRIQSAEEVLIELDDIVKNATLQRG